MYYNESNTNTENTGFVIEQLSKDEVNKLKKAVAGYGRLRRVSREIGIHENTLRGVILRESGRPDTIKLIRQKLSA